MNPIRQEITAFTRACERLLSQGGTLNEDERSLLEYYVNDLSREFLQVSRLWDYGTSKLHQSNRRIRVYQGAGTWELFGPIFRDLPRSLSC